MRSCHAGVSLLFIILVESQEQPKYVHMSHSSSLPTLPGARARSRSLSFSLSLSLFFSFWLHLMACGTLVLWPGLIPTLPAAEGEVLTNGPPGTCPLAFFQILSLVPQGLHTSCFPQIFSLFSLCLIPSHALDLNLEVTSSETFPDFPTHHPHYAP